MLQQLEEVKTNLESIVAIPIYSLIRKKKEAFQILLQMNEFHNEYISINAKDDFVVYSPLSNFKISESTDSFTAVERRVLEEV